MELTYLSMDSLQEGVGSSQVLEYVVRMATHGTDVSLLTFEKSPPSEELIRRVSGAGIAWTPEPFGRPGSRAGLSRVIRAARFARGRRLIHARSDLAAAATVIARSRNWVWDMRSLYADQKIELGELRRGSIEHRILKRLARKATESSSAIVTLTDAVIPELQSRYGHDVSAKTWVISTCVDLERFVWSPMPSGPLRFLLAGTLNAYYDVPLMLELVQRSRSRRETEFHVVAPPTSWDSRLLPLANSRGSAKPAEMPDVIAKAHVGLSVCRQNAGPSLKASMPTKIAEFLASGRPVLVNRNLGDAGDLLEHHRCGVAVDGHSAAVLEGALDQLDDLLTDEETPLRCRALAQSHFDIDRAVTKLMNLYVQLTPT